MRLHICNDLVQRRQRQVEAGTGRRNGELRNPWGSPVMSTATISYSASAGCMRGTYLNWACTHLCPLGHLVHRLSVIPSMWCESGIFICSISINPIFSAAPYLHFPRRYLPLEVFRLRQILKCAMRRAIPSSFSAGPHTWAWAEIPFFKQFRVSTGRLTSSQHLLLCRQSHRPIQTPRLHPRLCHRCYHLVHPSQPFTQVGFAGRAEAPW